MKSRELKGAVLALACALAGARAEALELPKIGLPEALGGSAEAPTTPGATADCPVIVLEEGMIRAPAGADAASVHHQLSIKSTARECVVEGDHVVIRVGVEGDAMLGPAGSAGSYGAGLRIALRRIKDESIIGSKSYRVNATIPANAARADFRVLADPIATPPSAHPQEDFEILVGFGEASSAPAEKATPRKKKKGRR
jgi:hypothetical protein